MKRDCGASRRDGLFVLDDGSGIQTDKRDKNATHVVATQKQMSSSIYCSLAAIYVLAVLISTLGNKERTRNRRVSPK